MSSHRRGRSWTSGGERKPTPSRRNKTCPRTWKPSTRMGARHNEIFRAGAAKWFLRTANLLASEALQLLGHYARAIHLDYHNVFRLSFSRVAPSIFIADP